MTETKKQMPSFMNKTAEGNTMQTSQNNSGIKEQMDVIACCGTKMGVVDHLENDAIKLTRRDSADGQHHFIPQSWVDHVDGSVYLTKNSLETERGWKSDANSCSC